MRAEQYTYSHTELNMALTTNAYTWNVLVVDVTESPIERSKKTARLLQWQKETAHVESPSGSQPSQRADHLHSIW